MSKLEIESQQIENGKLITYKGSHNFSVLVALALIKSSKLLQSEPKYYYFIENFDKLLSKSHKIAEFYNLTKEFKRFQLIHINLDPQNTKSLLKLKSKEIRSISIIFRCIMISFCPKLSEKILAGTVLFPKSFYYSILNCLSSFLGVTINIEQGVLEDIKEFKLQPSENSCKSFKVSEILKYEAPILFSPIITLKVTQTEFSFHLYCESFSVPTLNKIEKLKSFLKSLFNIDSNPKSLFRPADLSAENEIFLTNMTSNLPIIKHSENRPVIPE